MAGSSSIIIAIAESILPAVQADRILTKGRVRSWQEEGRSVEFISAALTASLAGEGNFAFKNLDIIKDSFLEFITSNVNQEYYSEAGISDDTLCTWELGENDNHCPNCLERAEMGEQPFSYWVEIGLPGEGATWCGGSCNCWIKKAE